MAGLGLIVVGGLSFVLSGIITPFTDWDGVDHSKGELTAIYVISGVMEILFGLYLTASS